MSHGEVTPQEPVDLPFDIGCGLEADGTGATIKSTRASSLAAIRAGQRDFFQRQKTKSHVFRDTQLRNLAEAIKALEPKILKALQADLGKHAAEAFTTEVGFIYNEIRHTRRHLAKWSKPEKLRPTMLTAPASCYVVREPLGSVLIIGPWNYPFQLLLAPLVGALAAGNTVVLKPSEMAPHTQAVLTELINDTFSEDLVAVFQGGAETSQQLLAQEWGHVFFTGSTRVGRLVAKAAAATFSPYTLELGGKSPCIVDEDANLDLAAKRIVWGKFTNAGQTCVAPDYLWVHYKVKDELVAKIKKILQKTFGKDPFKSPDFGRMITKQHAVRLQGFIAEGRIIVGGDVDVEERYVSPTLIDQIDFSHEVMREEIFGPLLPVLTFENISEIFSYLPNQDKPLALYYFGSSKDMMKRVTNELSYGGGCLNDTVMHLAHPDLPFGGVGASGVGAYHGRHSFELFSHKKSILKQSLRFDVPVRYAPYRGWQRTILRMLLRA